MQYTIDSCHPLTSGSPCLDFGFQYSVIRNTRSKEFGVEYWALPDSNSPWRPCTYIVTNFYQNQIKSLKYIWLNLLSSILDDPLNLNSTRKERKRPLHLLMHSQLSKFEFQLLHSTYSIMFLTFIPIMHGSNNKNWTQF